MTAQEIRQVIVKVYDELVNSGKWAQQEAQKDEHAKVFRRFWLDKVANKNYPELSKEKDLNPILTLIDSKAKGYAGGPGGAVAMTYIYQTSWYRMFNDFHSQKVLLDAMNQVFDAKTDKESASAIDYLQKINEKNKNGLTGKNANAINALLAINDPRRWISMVSLEHRYNVIEKLLLSNIEKLRTASYGEQIVGSNREIKEGFKARYVDAPPRLIGLMLYHPAVKPIWSEPSSSQEIIEEVEIEKKQEFDLSIDENAFAMEKHLEDFLITNWEKTDLGKKFDLIVDEGEMVSKQYRTDIGSIDILAQDRKDQSYVVIELKKGRPSDDVVGQTLRYIGWVQEKLAKGRNVSGVIIALDDDEKLKYALKPLNGRIKFYRYKVQFNLVEIE